MTTTDPSLAEVCDQVLDLVARIESPSALVVLIDGGSGSGKSDLADLLVGVWPAPVQLVRLDDIYPGWGGLNAATEYVRHHILEPLRENKPARWQRWDWLAGARAEWHEIDPACALIVEGSGSLSVANRQLADLSLWLEVDPDVRKARALARDGEVYAGHWDEWAAQEAEFAAANRPREIASAIFTPADHGSRENPCTPTGEAD